MHHHRIHAFHRVRAVPAVGLLLRAEHQCAPAVVDLHAVLLDFVGVAENRQENRIFTVIVRGEGVGQVELLRTVLVVDVHRVPVAEALVADLHTVSARSAHQIGGLRAAVLPQVVAVGNLCVQCQGLALAQQRVRAEVDRKIVEVADVYRVARPETVVRDDHPVVAVLPDRVCRVGARVLPVVLCGVRLRGVQQQRGQLAKDAVAAEIHSGLPVEAHVEAVALGAAPDVGDAHLERPGGVHRDGWGGRAVAPEVGDRAGLLHGKGRAGAHGGVVRDGDERRRHHRHERRRRVGTLVVQHALHGKRIQCGEQERIGISEVGDTIDNPLHRHRVGVVLYMEGERVAEAAVDKAKVGT